MLLPQNDNVPNLSEYIFVLVYFHVHTYCYIRCQDIKAAGHKIVIVATSV